jgi:hypothetical protein
MLADFQPQTRLQLDSTALNIGSAGMPPLAPDNPLPDSTATSISGYSLGPSPGSLQETERETSMPSESATFTSHDARDQGDMLQFINPNWC